MNKKLICLVLAMVMLCAAPLTFATAAKSPPGTPRTQAVLGAADQLSATVIGLTAAAQTELAEIAAFTAANVPVIGYFGDAVKAAVAALLPAGFDVESLVMHDFDLIALTGMDPSFNDFAQPFVYGTAYPDGANIVALLGIEGGSGVEWVALKAEVVNGFVVVYFTQAVLIALNGRTGMLAILSEAI
ncbi:MAG: hypothetical protein FWD25_04580 [Clostridia bacterium]|nr:hypothetical protein [Clostridia bacterium]